MNAQPSAGVVFRALVMLACVVAIPVVALSGSSLPKTVKDLMDGKWPGGQAEGLKPNVSPQLDQVASTSVNLTAPSPAAPSAANGNPAWATPSAAMPMSAPPAMCSLNPPPAGTQNVVPAGFTAEPTARPLAVPADHAAMADLFAQAQNGRPMMADNPSPPPAAPATAALPSDGAVTLAHTGAGTRPVVPVGPVDRPRELRPTSDNIPAVPTPPAATDAAAERGALTQYQQWLQQQGATYLALETWGAQQQLFRCHCQMAIGGNPNCTRHFEATSADPLQAMAQVVAQVEAWRTQAPAAGSGPG